MKVRVSNSIAKLLSGAVIACGVIGAGQVAQAADMVPTFKINPNWPKVLPHGWTTGVIGGLYVDKDDNVWIAQRPSSVTASTETYALDGLGACCAPAPPVMEFDQSGKLVQAWGAIHMTNPAERKEHLVGQQVPGSNETADFWPSSEHAMYVDYKGNVWVSSQSAPDQFIKFTHDGKVIKRFGTKESTTNKDTANLAGPTGVYVNPKTNEAFISDGYRDRRILVVDADTFAFKRMWGADGKPPRDAGPIDAFGTNRVTDQWSVTHCVRPDKDGNLYVCDRANSRIQEFKQDGTFIRQIYVGGSAHTGPGTVHKNGKISIGAAWDVAFSADPDQQFMYVSDGENKKVLIYRRSDFKYLGAIGHGGRQAGEFETPHVIATDSHGNLYVGETLSGNRIQRFDFTGLAPAPAHPEAPEAE